ncbi:hypothetical protein HYDPIDRAFT_28846 [Hydnomerulius pinastri MD-312]|uniref:F-box domain-containing protein n=1 Tax=Hydnomerulius pinastri MD-312 TaxID=994086 RepID=A0A0C9W8Q2_9AGAM|nr:hypothetical protein HYDPIDRAFT_28846 [Hydnomerulius pinastri MD-312]
MSSNPPLESRKSGPLSPDVPPAHLCNELLLKIFSELKLPTLIAATGVCRKWRALVPCADILPARRVLLDLHLSIIPSPTFLPAEDCAIAPLCSSDREAFLEKLDRRLVGKGLRLPEEMRFWVLEWPGAAALSWASPADLSQTHLHGKRANSANLAPEPHIEKKFFTDTWLVGDRGIHMMKLSGGSAPSGFWIALDDKSGVADTFGKVYLCAGREILDQVASSWMEWIKRRLGKVAGGREVAYC